MNSMLKFAIAGALTLGATSAFAALPDPASGASDLVLVVQNNTTQATYVLDTGVTISSLLGTYVSGATADLNTWTGINKNIAATSGLSTFLSGAAATGYSWVIQASQYPTTATNGTSKPPGANVAIFTSSGGTANVSSVTGATLANLNAYANNTHQSLTVGGPLSVLAGASEGTATTAYSTADQQKYGLFLVNDMSNQGTPSELFALTGDGTTGQVESYNLGTVVLNADGSLTFAGNGTGPAVPLPAAVWLFGSGLMGLVGVSRRRKAAAAV